MEEKTSDKHKFQEDSEMTFERVFNFAYRGYIALMQNLAKELGEDGFLEALEKASSKASAQRFQKRAEDAPSNDFSAFTALVQDRNRFWKHVYSMDIVENTETAFEVRVTECLWAKTYREANAADIGYARHCHPDFAECQAFNPRIRLIRTKTLMQGDDCCNFRWVWEE